MNLWPRVKRLFETDDGSLPDIYVENLSSDEVVAVYEWLMTQCEIAHSPTLWSVERQQNLAIRDIPNPARAFVEGRVETIHHCLVGLYSHGVSLPELSVSVEPDGLSFDYRMGNHWTERTVLALFELLRKMQQRVPQARIFQTDEGGYPRPNFDFSEAFTAYGATVTDVQPMHRIGPQTAAL
jgi:hypothetical protein